jgi:hypothetical protein
MLPILNVSSISKYSTFSNICKDFIYFFDKLQTIFLNFRYVNLKCHHLQFHQVLLGYVIYGIGWRRRPVHSREELRQIGLGWNIRLRMGAKLCQTGVG